MLECGGSTRDTPLPMAHAPDPIREPSALEAAFAADTFLLFKHSFRCPISARAFDEYRAFCAGLSDGERIATGWIDVVAQRPWSLDVARRSGVEHESPQALLLERGRVVWHAAHGSITRASLAQAIGARARGLEDDPRP